MKIIKCNLITYLKKYTPLTAEDIEEAKENCFNEPTLYNFIESCLGYPIWNYPIEEIDYLLEKEADFKKEYNLSNYDEVYILLYGRLWETDII